MEYRRPSVLSRMYNRSHADLARRTSEPLRRQCWVLLGHKAQQATSDFQFHNSICSGVTLYNNELLLDKTNFVYGRYKYIVGKHNVHS